MKTWHKVLMGIGALAVLSVAILGLSVLSFNNRAVKAENGIEAQYKQNQNVLSTYFNKILEAIQIPERYKNDLKEVFDSSIKSRYGKDGSKAVFQFLKEHNPNFDSKLYIQIEQIIESGRNDFSNEQKTLLDKKQTYENMRGTWPNSLYASFLGFPKKDIAKMDIVTDDRTQKAFDTKKMEPLDLSGKNK